MSINSAMALKPCPFCGYDKPDLTDNRGLAFWVECPICQVETLAQDSVSEAASTWNGRATFTAALGPSK